MVSSPVVVIIFVYLLIVLLTVKLRLRLRSKLSFRPKFQIKWSTICSGGSGSISSSQHKETGATVENLSRTQIQPNKPVPVPVPVEPTNIPIFSSVYYWLSTGCSLRKNLRFFGKIDRIAVQAKYLVYRFVIINDFHVGKEAFKKLAFSGRPSADTWCYPSRGSHGIMNSNGKKWEEQRRFCLRNLRNFGFGTKSMESLIQREVTEFTEGMRKLNGKLISPNAKFYLPVVNSLWMIFAGERSSCEDDKMFQMTLKVYDGFMRSVQFPELAVVGAELKSRTIESIAKYFPFVKWIFPGLASFHEATEELRNYFKELITARQMSINLPDAPRDLLDVYVKEILTTTDEDSEFYKDKGVANLLGVMMDFFLAGGETTADMLQWNMLHLIRNPDMQKKIQAEIDTVVGFNRVPVLSDRPNCPYTEAFMEEVLRFNAASLMSLPHTTLEDGHVGPYSLPKGTTVFLNIENIHKDPSIWGDPENFRPQRFLSDDGQSFVRNEAMVAFSVGRRKCPGEQLARDNLFLFVSSICQRFALERDPKLKGRPKLKAQCSGVNSPKTFHMIFHERK